MNMMKDGHAVRRGAWFEQERFGLFIHWGLYAIPALGEWHMHRKQIPPATYNKLADEFNPEPGCVDRWVALAKRAGAGYVVLTTRHHDGFALFDSAASDFTSVKTAAGRDFVREFVKACRRHKIRVGFYYSIMSWQYPACLTGHLQDPEGWEAMVDQTHEQLRELMTNYGRVDLLWYDGCVAPGLGDELILRKLWRTREMNAMVRRLQPDILINNRSALPEDFATPEQEVASPPRGRRWEACMTLNRSWGYVKDDKDFKSVREVTRHLVHCASNGGNLLLNIGPKADGSVQSECVKRLKAIGDWMALNGESVRGSERTDFSEAAHVAGPVTLHDDRAYVHLFDWKGGDAALAGFAGTGITAKLLGGKRVALESIETGVLLARKRPASPTSDMRGPMVLRIDVGPHAKLMRPALIVGGETPAQELPSDAPILAPPTGRHDPDHAPVIPAAALHASSPDNQAAIQLEDGATWCPNWNGWQVAAQRKGGSLSFPLDVPADGRYNLLIGVIAARSISAQVLIDETKAGTTQHLRYSGYPDAILLPKTALSKGRRRISVEVNDAVPFGVYNVHLEPVWRPLPSELWHTIGPFPTSFSVHSPLSVVRDALTTRLPAEKEFKPGKEYPGAGALRVGWSWTKARRGKFAAQGVDFPNRCGIKASGICLARTVIDSPAAYETELCIGCDWWGNAYLNGKLVTSARDPAEAAKDGAWFNTWKPTSAKIRLRKGRNTLLVKCHPGSCANWFTCFINDPGDLRIQAEK